MIITTDPIRVETQLSASGWAPPAITEGSRPRLYRCDALPDRKAPEDAAIPAR